MNRIIKKMFINGLLPDENRKFTVGNISSQSSYVNNRGNSSTFQTLNYNSPFQLGSRKCLIRIKIFSLRVGDNAKNSVSFDLDGNELIIDNKIDIGAYELSDDDNTQTTHIPHFPYLSELKYTVNKASSQQDLPIVDSAD